MSIKISETGYVKTKISHGLLGLVEVLIIPTGKTRDTNGTTEAEFFQISGAGTERFLWLSRNQII